ncbi:MAG TPA: hypothetical protein VIN59_05465 [Alphaproteobacteria bacterium]
MKTIVMTCRDRGPAQHLAEIAKGIQGSGLYQLVIHAQEPALETFKKAGLTVNEVSVPYALLDDAGAKKQLADYAERIVSTNPHLVIVGFSTTRDTLGIDEAVLEQYQGKALVMQDAPDWYSPVVGRHHYLCTTADAVRSAVSKGYDASLVGSPKMQSYASKDYAALANRFQQTHARAFSENAPVLTFCGQYLTEFPGYVGLIKSLAQAVARTDAKLIYRAHPREWVRGTDIEITSNIFDRFLGTGAWIMESKDTPQDDSIAGSHAIVSYCSGSLIDAVHMNHYSDQALAVPIALMWDKDLNKDVGGTSGPIEPFEQMSQGRGIVVSDEKYLENAIREMAYEDHRHDYYRRMRGETHVIDNPVARALRVIAQTIPAHAPKHPVRPSLRMS